MHIECIAFLAVSFGFSCVILTEINTGYKVTISTHTELIFHSVKTAPTKLCCCAFSCRYGEPPAFSVLTLPRAPPPRGKDTNQGLPCLVCHPRPLWLYAHATRSPFPMLQKWGNLLPSSPVPSESDSYTREQRIPSIAPVSSFQGSKTVGQLPPFRGCPQVRHRGNARRGGLAWFMYLW